MSDEPYRYLDSRGPLGNAISAAQAEVRRVEESVRAKRYQADEEERQLPYLRRRVEDLVTHSDAANKYVRDQYEARQVAAARGAES